MMTAPDRLLLDTEIVIHLLKKQPEAVERFIALKEFHWKIICWPPLPDKTVARCG